jgi:hypothetical protein
MSQSDGRISNQFIQRALEPCRPIFGRNPSVRFPIEIRTLRTNLWTLQKDLSDYQNTELGTRHPAYSSLVAQTNLVLSSPLLFTPSFHHIPTSLESALQSLTHVITHPEFSFEKVSPAERENLKTFFVHLSLYLGREIQEHIQNILFLAEANHMIRFILNRKPESNFINIHDRFSRIDSLHGLLRRLSGDLTDCICLRQGKSYLLQLPGTIKTVEALLTVKGVSSFTRSLLFQLWKVCTTNPDFPPCLALVARLETVKLRQL